MLKGPYDARVPPIVKFSQESESARLTKIILSKGTIKPFKHLYRQNRKPQFEILRMK